MTRGCVAMAALGLLFACRRGASHRPGEEWLDSVRVVGNQSVPDNELLPGLALRRTQMAERTPDPYLIQMDEDRIRGQYLRRGFLEIEVSSRVERHGDAADVTFVVVEGARSTTRFAFEGVPREIPRETLLAQFNLADGAPYDHNQLDPAKPLLLAVLQDAGYARAKLDAQVIADKAEHTVTISIEVVPGPKCQFGKVDIVGAVDPDLRAAVERRITFVRGEPFTAAALVRTRDKLYQLQRFSTVRIEPDPSDAPIVDMKVSVAEGASHEVKLGGGVGADPITFEVRGRAGYQVIGWPFALDTVTLDFRPAYALLRNGAGYEPRVRAVARLERQDFLITDMRGSIEAGYDYLQVEAYTSYGPRAALGLSVPVGDPHVQLSVGWAIEGIQFRDVNPLIDATLAHRLGIDHFERVGAFNQALSLDLRDSAIEPTFGMYAQVRLTEGGAYAGGSYQFLQASPDVRGYLPLGPVTLAARARYGGIFGDAPPTERYFAGGAASNRGFAERQMAPFVSGVLNGSFRSVPFGGTSLVDSGIEARFPITKIRKMKLGGVVFFDAGDVGDRASDLSLGNLNCAAGLGLRLLTIIGPARLDFGYRLNRTGPLDPEPSDTYAFHISLGEAF